MKLISQSYWSKELNIIDMEIDLNYLFMSKLLLKFMYYRIPMLFIIFKGHTLYFKVIDCISGSIIIFGCPRRILSDQKEIILCIWSQDIAACNFFSYRQDNLKDIQDNIKEILKA